MLLVAGACAFLLGHVRVVLHSISPAFRVGQTSVVTTSAVHYGHIEQPQVSSLRTWHFRVRGVMGILTLLPCVPLALLLGSREAPKVIWIDPGLWIHGRIVRHVVILVNDDATLMAEFREAEFLQGFRYFELVRLRGVLGLFAIRLCGII
jgi:hypothetical protein